MLKTLLFVGSVSVVGGALFTFGAVASGAVAAAQSVDKSPVEVSLSAGPVFPVKVAAKSKAAEVAPNGAQYRVRSGKSGFRYVACDRQRAFGSAVEFGCLSWSKSKGWGKSIRWFPKYQLHALTGDLPAAPAEVASK